MPYSKVIQKKLYINQIPLIEICLETIGNKSAPLLVFYHGWTSDKIKGSEFGETLAKFGFRVVIPDCAYHGERVGSPKDIGVTDQVGNQQNVGITDQADNRQNVGITDQADNRQNAGITDQADNRQNIGGLRYTGWGEHELRMWDVHYIFLSVIETAIEFPLIVQHYKEQNLIADDYYAAAGVSMGGIITNVLLRKYPDIKAAGILMGCPQLQKFAQWLVLEGAEDLMYASEEFYPEIMLPDERLQLGIINRETDLVLKMIPDLAKWDLSEEPRSIDNRPVLYWHAEPDPIVPCQLTSDFIDTIETLPEAKNVYFYKSAEGSHLVPLIETRRLGKFLCNDYFASIAINSKTMTEPLGQD